MHSGEGKEAPPPGGWPWLFGYTLESAWELINMGGRCVVATLVSCTCLVSPWFSTASPWAAPAAVVTMTVCPGPQASALATWNSWRKTSPVSPFIYLFLSHLFIPGLTDNLFSLGRNLIFSLFTLLLNLFQFWWLGVFPSWILMLFQNAPNLLSFPSFREYFLNFWHNKMSLAHLVFSLPLSQNQPFLWGAVVPLLLEIAFRNGDTELDLPGAPWVSLLRPRGGGSWWPRVGR